MKNLLSLFKRDGIGEPPWEYDFLLNLNESEYPKYLKKIFEIRTDEKLDLKHPKTFNQKIQWIKLYGVTDLMRDCTDKVKVRDYVKKIIKEEYLSDEISSGYLKPSLQICNNFDEINFENLPNQFVIKCNHGCKWQYIIKNKEEFLLNKQLFETVKRNMTGWLEQEYWCWGGFEMQYKDINPRIIIETFLGNKRETAQEIEVFCFNSKSKIIKYVYNDIPDKISMYDENLNNIDFKFLDKEILVEKKANDLINQAFLLSEQLTKGFSFARVDWLVFNKKLYFNEMTFTPNSGMIRFDKKWNKQLGDWINLER